MGAAHKLLGRAELYAGGFSCHSVGIGKQNGVFSGKLPGRQWVNRSFDSSDHLVSVMVLEKSRRDPYREGERMKILAVNGSPRGKAGNTDTIVQNFLEGARLAGAETETVYLNEKNIRHCLGCFSCWTKTPGICIQKDDMSALLNKLLDADLLLYATPLYFFTVSGLLKDFMDRMLPLSNPEINQNDVRYGHPSRYVRYSEQRVVLISSCGFPNQENFSGLIETFRVMTRDRLDLAILRSQGGMLTVGRAQKTLAPYFDSVREAGRQMVECGSVSSEIQTYLEKDLIDPQVYVKNANRSWN